MSDENIDRFPDLAWVIGANARKFRNSAGLTLDQVALAARRRGLRWSESRVADFEGGRVAPNLTTLLALCLAFADLGCSEATLPKLVRFVQPMRVNDGQALWDFEITGVLAGEPVVEPTPAEPGSDDGSATLITTPYERKLAQSLKVDLGSISRTWRSSGATEERLRKTLGVSSMMLAMLSASLWGQTFAAERDARAGDDATPQKRGQVTRRMQAELKEEIARHTPSRKPRNRNPVGDDL